MTRSLRYASLALLIVACSHSEPFVLGSYRETGPLVPGPEARIAGGGSWTEDGGGILFVAGCYGYPSFEQRKYYPYNIVDIIGIAMLPASGGSVVWERCELGYPFIGSVDSVARFTAAALGKGGSLLFVEFVGPRPTCTACDYYAIFYHSELYLADSGQPLNTRRKLATLFRESVGHPVVPPEAINQLTRLAWVGKDTFVAEASNLNPNRISTPLGLARGLVTADSALLTVIPGTANTHRWSVAEAGVAVVFSEDSLTLQRVPFAGGTVTALAAIPAGGRRHIDDVSCRGDLCLVLSSEDTTTATGQLKRVSAFWTVSVATGTVALLRADQKLYSSAKLSPTSNVVLVGENDGMHLFSELLH